MSLAGIFLDRDGTLISHVDYLHNPEEVFPLQGIAVTMRALREAGYLLFLFTNQSGVGRRLHCYGKTRSTSNLSKTLSSFHFGEH